MKTKTKQKKISRFKIPFASFPVKRGISKIWAVPRIQE